MDHLKLIGNEYLVVMKLTKMETTNSRIESTRNQNQLGITFADQWHHNKVHKCDVFGVPITEFIKRNVYGIPILRVITDAKNETQLGNYIFELWHFPRVPAKMFHPQTYEWKSKSF